MNCGEQQDNIKLYLKKNISYRSKQTHQSTKKQRVLLRSIIAACRDGRIDDFSFPAFSAVSEENGSRRGRDDASGSTGVDAGVL
eukprot:scaffold1864_cov60-Cyclotella_meneghiniana.AAC.1